ncbi:MAG TPA: amidohydrolase/deacetylase family metallohydrolase [Chloroflexota bacterium]|nr:amidohydrolase/deacetylase family metallohydrolase [Chloroflexota bacterium]
MPAVFDVLIAGGTVLDPVSGRRPDTDVGVTGGRITAIGEKLNRNGATRVLDARGCFVTPGLIDFHVHSYWGVNPYGFEADYVCLRNGVTTAVDAGSSGPVNFLGFKRFIAERSRTRMLAFVCVAQHGVLNGPGELEDLRFADPEGCAEAILAHPDVAIGVKVRLHEKVGANGPQALVLAIQAGEASHSPVMVHIGDTQMPIEDIVDMLRPGDIVTHCFTPLRPSITDDEHRHVRPAVMRAHERGVLFDVGHANRHLDFTIARACLAEGLAPDTISTDLHGRGGRDLVADLPTSMTKFLALGMSLEQVVAACTINPAKAIGWQDRLGRLEIGRQADIAVLQLVDGPVSLRDSVGATLDAPQRLLARWTVRNGEVFEGATD